LAVGRFVHKHGYIYIYIERERERERERYLFESQRESCRCSYLEGLEARGDDVHNRNVLLQEAMQVEIKGFLRAVSERSSW